jgi:large subunit ribosomal protein L33
MRENLFLECSECRNRNYTTSREMRRGSKLELKKYCRFCRKCTVHKEHKM